MVQGERPRASPHRAFTATIVFCCGFLAVVALGLSTRQAQALPSFARQTGQPCGTCHTDYPGLTPYGRRFKLYGYTIGGGKYRTPMLSPPKADVAFEYAKSAALPFPALAAKEKSDLIAYADTIHPIDAPVVETGPKGWVPPISVMGILGFTHTDSPLPQTAPFTPPPFPQTAPFQPNDNLVLAPVSFFWGGAITDHVGAFAQFTYSGPGAGPPGDPFVHNWGWDQTDIRYANAATIGNFDIVWGLTFNNNPSNQDLWNSTPAWSYPFAYAVSTLAGPPTGGTMLEGTWGPGHVGSVGIYAMINDILYLEATGYRTLDFHTQNSFGVDPLGAPGLFDGVAPYWRIAIEPHWGNHYLMLGAFGMLAKVHPWINMLPTVDPTATAPQTDNFTDIGLDTQYQYQGAGWWLTLRGSLIREYQYLYASFVNGLSSSPGTPNNELNSLRLYASVALGNDNRIVLTAQHFNIWAHPDLLAATTDSNGWIAELAYIPYGLNSAPGWPWANVRMGLQYTWYNRLNGLTNTAQNNNTVFLFAWFAM
jgi:hypothetical protein